MKRIGITGGVGAGKSQVMDYLKERWQAVVLRTDDLAKELMEPGQPGLLGLIRLFGTEILTEDGQLNRPALAERLFQGELAERDRLAVNALIHPLVWERVEELTYEAEQAGKELVAVESALFEPKHLKAFPEIWYIYTDTEVRISRLMASRGYSRKRCEAMLAGQAGDLFFRSFCRVIIDNSGSFEETKRQIDCTFLNSY